MKSAHQEEEAGRLCCCPFSATALGLRHSLRWLILVVSLVAFTLTYANNITFNFAVICIIRPEKGAGNTSGWTEKNADPKENFYYDYSVQQRNFLFSAGALGAICSSLVATQMIGRIGLRSTFAFFGASSALSCLFMPLAVQTGFAPMLVLRMVQGSLHPVQDIMMSQLTLDWAPLRTAGTYLVFLSAHFQLGPLFTMPISGLLCESSLGWPAIYYMQGTLTLLVFCIFFALFRDTPMQHPYEIIEQFTKKAFVLTLQLHQRQGVVRDKVIIQAQMENNKKKQLKVPYKQIFTDPIVWVVLFTYWSAELGFLIFIQYGPIYLNRVLGMDLKKTGFLAALPYLLSMMAKFVSGPINDRLPWKSERIRINIFAALSQIGMIIAFLALTVLPLTKGIPQWLVQVAFISVNLFSGLDFLGVIRCSLRISQQFSAKFAVAGGFISAITSFFLPFIVGLVAPNNRVEEWSRILIGIALFLTVTIVFFFAFCDSQPRPWTAVPLIEDEEAENQQKEENSTKTITFVEKF